MITEEIEKALVNGTAKLKTFMLATSAVGRIHVPHNNFIIVTSISAFPFSDVVGDLGINPAAAKAQLNARSNHVVELINQDSDRVGFIFRNNYEYIFAKTQTYVKNSEPVTFNTNLVRTSDVFISIGNWPGLSGGNISVYFPQPLLGIPPNPTSYGSTTSVYAEVLDAGFLWFYYPQFNQHETNLFPTPKYRNQPLPYYSGEDALYGRLNDVTGVTAPNNRTPIVQIQYVQMNKTLLQNYSQQ